MVRTREELLKAVQERLGEDNSDEAIALIEDVTDTFTDMETRVSEAGDWKQKYEDNDKMWRDKYKDRFLNTDYQQEDEQEYEEDDVTKEIKTYEDLFEVKEN